ncbi:MAG: hypothetical protein NXI04_03915 [Planctomycetaceae bacterium]|nr:hypothetical protein [Planctomycetaceae bacterium]
MTSLIDQVALQKQGKLICQAPVSTVVATLKELETLDQAAEAGVKKWRTIGCLSIFGLVGGVFLAAQELIVPGGILMVAGVATAVTGLVKASQHGRLDVENRRYEFVAGLLDYLRRDIGKDESLFLQLDIRPHNDRSKFDRKGTAGRWKASFFVDPWLVLRGRLQDGTKFVVSMVEKQQDRHRTKRSASGKLKTKYKTKNASELVIALRPKPKRYPAAAEVVPPQDCDEALPAWATVKNLAVTNGVLEFRSTTKAGWHVTKETSGQRQDAVGWAASKLVYLYGLLHSSQA